MASPLKSIGIERGDKVTRLEAFVDASFAFALTLLVIAGDTIPGSVDELTAALKQIPTYVLSFHLIAQLWSAHAKWSRWFGIDDDTSTRLSLMLVLLLLIFVYPLKMVFGAFFHAISGGWLPATFTLQSGSDILVMFQVFTVGYGAMALVMALLFGHAVKLAGQVDFSPVERLQASHYLRNWLFVAGFCLASFLLATFMPLGWRDDHRLGLPGYLLFGLFAFQLVRRRLHDRRLRQIQNPV
jgi:hypothetical protein